MFTGDDMIQLRNAVRDYRKLSFMGDMNFICLNQHALREPNLVLGLVTYLFRVYNVQLKTHFEQSSNSRGALPV